MQCTDEARGTGYEGLMVPWQMAFEVTAPQPCPTERVASGLPGQLTEGRGGTILLACCTHLKAYLQARAGTPAGEGSQGHDTCTGVAVRKQRQRGEGGVAAFSGARFLRAKFDLAARRSRLRRRAPSCSAFFTSNVHRLGTGLLAALHASAAGALLWSRVGRTISQARLALDFVQDRRCEDLHS